MANHPTKSAWERLALPLTGMSAATFAALAALRRNRVFHPVGEAYFGTLDLRTAGADILELRFLDGTHRVIVRFSRGAGVPEPVPDVLGLAIKIPAAGSGEIEQDLLLASSASAPGARNLLIPVRSFFRCTYSSILPYRAGVAQVLFGARAISSLRDRKGDFADLERAGVDGDLHFEILVARLTGAWVKIGSLSVQQHCDQETARALRFNPWNTNPELQPAGPLNTLRRSTYKASQRARPD
ncbi:MAG: hypothetical protein M3280_12605 [Actinomycetota bacterium]|nr:hypothetical protein [Actinomycetota bacterium]